MMPEFVAALVDGDLSGLGPGDQTEAWDKIYMQYSELSQQGTHNEVMELMRDIAELRAKIVIVNGCVQYLQMSYDVDLVGLLNKMALRCDVLPGDREQMLVDKLNGVVARMKRWLPMLATKEQELDVFQRGAEGKKITWEYFYDWIDAIGSHKGYAVRMKDLSVAQFCRNLVKITQESTKQQMKDASNTGR